MKKINLFLGIVSSFLVSSFAFSNSNSILNPNFNNNSRYLNEEIKVSTYEQLENAMSSTGDITIVFQNDIDLSNFTGNYITNNKESSDQNIIIDGNGHGFINKPSDYYSSSIFDDFQLRSEKTISITFRNLILDNVGSFIGDISYYSLEDYDAENPDPAQANLIGKGLTFQNITIKNNVKENETFYLNPYISKADLFHIYQSLSFLVNNILLRHTGADENDEALTFKNIIIKDNHIDNNNFYIVNPLNTPNSDFRPIILESFLSNLEYVTCSYSNHTHHSFVTYEYIYIKDNSFSNNIFKIGQYLGDDFIFEDFSKKIYESFGNLSGNANGITRNPGTSGNYLIIHDIYIGNNVITESKKYNANDDLIINKYVYSEIISNSNLDAWKTYISTLVFSNILIFNNKSYYINENGDYQLNSQENINMLNIPLLDKNNNVTSWESVESENLYIYGPMYNSENQIKMFEDVSLSSESEVNYAKYLFEDDYEYYTLVNFLTNKFGIYGYEINFDPVEVEGETKNAISSISIVQEEHVEILSDNLIYQENSTTLTQIELSFKYYQNLLETGPVNVPYKIDNLKLFYDQNEDQKFEPGEIVASNNELYFVDNYSYNVRLTLINETKLDQELIDNFNLNNLYLGFDYSNDSNQKESSSTILKIDPNQLKSSFVGTPLTDVINKPTTSDSTLFIIIASVVGLIIFIVLITLLIALILWLLKRKKDKNYISKNNEYYNSNQIAYDNQNDYYDNYQFNDYSNYSSNENYDYDPYYEEEDI